MFHRNAIKIIIPVLVLIAAACSCLNTPAFTTPATNPPAANSPTVAEVQAAPTDTPLPPAPVPTDTPAAPANSICGWIENTSTTGVMAPTMKIWDTGKVLKLYMLEMDAINKLDYSAPAWYRVYDPVYQDPDLLVNFSSVEKVSNCP